MGRPDAQHTGVSIAITGPQKHRKYNWSLETAEEVRHPIFLEFGKDQKGLLSAKKEMEKTWLMQLRGDLETLKMKRKIQKASKDKRRTP